MAVNLSVWESVEALEQLRLGDSHAVSITARRLVRERDAPFRHVADTAQTYPSSKRPWGSLPLTAHGDSDFAFGWSHMAHIKLWMSRKCG